MERGDCQVSEATNSVDNPDRLSTMPDEVIHHIFSGLQTIGLVQASVLSKRWRYLWTSMPNLNFDKSEMSNICTLEGSFAYFMKCMSSLSRRGSCCLNKLRVSSPDHCDAWYILLLIDNAREHEVKEIDLDIVPPPPLRLLESGGMRALGFGNSLVVLKLNLNYGRMPISLGCERLMALHLVSIVFPNEAFVAEIFSSCPLLEKFTIERCIMGDIKVLEIVASNLKYLAFVNNGLCTFTDHGSFGVVLKVVAPKLLSFIYYGYNLRDYQIESLSSLGSASVHFKDLWEKHDHRFCRMVKGFYNANSLRLTLPFFQHLPTADEQECFPIAFCNLKSLAVCAGFTPSHLQVLIHLLKHFPNLEALAIDCEQFCVAGVPIPMEPWFEPVSCLRCNLKKVELINTYGTEIELEFVSYFLAHGRVLEEVAIPWTKNMVHKVNQFRKAFSFSKASTNVVLSFPKHQPQKPFWYSFT